MKASFSPDAFTECVSEEGRILKLTDDRNVAQAVDHETVWNIGSSSARSLQPEQDAIRRIFRQKDVEQSAARDRNSIYAHGPAKMAGDINVTGAIEADAVGDIAGITPAVLRPHDIASGIIFDQQPVIVALPVSVTFPNCAVGCRLFVWIAPATYEVPLASVAMSLA